MIEVDDTKSNAGDEAAAAATTDEDARRGGDGDDGDDGSGDGDDGGDAFAAPSDSHVELDDQHVETLDQHIEPPDPRVEALAQHVESHDPHVEPLVLQPDFRPGERSQYRVAELLAFHDRHFVEGVYRAILGRAPFPAEGARELDELRGGRAGKVEIIERLLTSPEAGRRRVRVEGLPSPAMRRLGRVPVVGYLLRLARALARLPVLMQHHQQFESYALAQQQLIADYLNRTLAQLAHRDAPAVTGDGAPAQAATAPTQAVAAPSPPAEIVEALEMFSDALLDLSNSHAELEARTEALREQTETQVGQAQAALAELTVAVSTQQQLSETFRREQQLAADALRREQQLAADALQRGQQLAADAQQEFLIQEQRVIVETQQVVLEELREELRALSERQQRARADFDAEVRRLRSLREAAATTRENFSGQA
jgi:hypothetical protein